MEKYGENIGQQYRKKYGNCIMVGKKIVGKNA